jgi:single-stranded-DNA-specific exonuclease
MTLWIDPTPSTAESPLPGLHPLVAQTLLQRGLANPEAARAFLDPGVYLPSPALELPGLDSAADLILRSIHANDSICVWGDFDVDGQTSTTVLVQTLQALGAQISYHIPVRKNESHGVNIENLARIIAQGAKLVVTCDTGIGANDAVEYASSRGVKMVITDHHDLPPELPKAAALVNPKMLPGAHPLACLAGVGVAYKLAEELLERQPAENLQAADLQDLAALGLVADLALLRGDARYLVQKGLEGLRHTRRLGLKTMLELADLTPAHLTEEHIGFMLGPRLNALGRLGDANPIVEFFTTNDAARVRVIATQLEGLNAQRKLLCDQVYRAAEAQLREKPELLAQPVIVLAHPQWPGGVVGIVASRIVERYHKPAILFCAPNGKAARGSARSISGLNISAAIAAQKDLLLGFGGHPMAAGLALDPEKLSEFRRKLGKTVEKMLGESAFDEARLQIDSWLELDSADLALAEQLESLSPYGPGNEKPILASHGLRLKNSAKLGKNQEHVKLTVEDENGNPQQVLWWNGGEETLPSGRFDLAYTLRASNWRGERQAQLEFVDFRIVEVEKIEIPRQPLEVLDLRGCPDPLERLKLEMQPADSLCWAEGREKKRASGRDRNELGPAGRLIVWSTPPSRAELNAALEIVKPQKVIVFAIDPGADEPQAFLERLAGLVKFTLNQKSGQTSYAELAAASAQKVAAARLGLEWLALRGQVRVETRAEDRLLLTPGGKADEKAADATLARLNALLEESAAYRRQFQKRASLALE